MIFSEKGGSYRKNLGIKTESRKSIFSERVRYLVLRSDLRISREKDETQHIRSSSERRIEVRVPTPHESISYRKIHTPENSYDISG